MRERLNAYYESQQPSEACVVRLCNLEQQPKRKPMLLRFALPVAAACLLALVLLTQLRPTPEGVVVPLATATPTAETTLPQKTPTETAAPATPEPIQETQLPIQTDEPIVSSSDNSIPAEGGYPMHPTKVPFDMGFGGASAPGSGSYNGSGSAGLSPDPGSMEPENTEPPEELEPQLVTDIDATYDSGFVTLTDLNTGAIETLDLRDELAGATELTEWLSAFGRDLILVLEFDSQTDENGTVTEEYYSIILVDFPK